MSIIFDYAAFLLLIAFIVAMARVFIGPDKGDRILSLQLIGTTGAALLLILSDGGRVVGFIESAIVLGLLASITVCVFVFSNKNIIDTTEDE